MKVISVLDIKNKIEIESKFKSEFNKKIQDLKLRTRTEMSLKFLFLALLILMLNQCQVSAQTNKKANPTNANTSSNVNQWYIDHDHSKVIFMIKHAGLSTTTGSFNKLYGNLSYDGKNLEKATCSALIEPDSINTGVASRDMHLRTADFFDIKNFQRITFNSSKVVPSGTKKFKLYGNLEIKGIKKEIILETEGPFGPITDDLARTRIGFSASTKLIRKDFGIKWNHKIAPGVDMIAPDVDVRLELEFIKAPEKNSNPFDRFKRS